MCFIGLDFLTCTLETLMGNAVQHRSTMVAKRRCDIRMKIPLMFRRFGLDISVHKDNIIG